MEDGKAPVFSRSFPFSIYHFPLAAFFSGREPYRPVNLPGCRLPRHAPCCGLFPLINPGGKMP
jgi:hypothetical protein